MQVPIVLNPRTQTAHIEGPTVVQARKMGARVTELRAIAAAALAAGQDDRAFDFDCAAFDVEADLRRYGFERFIPPAG